MERTLIALNVPNTITVSIMALLGWGALLVAYKLFNRQIKAGQQSGY